MGVGAVSGSGAAGLRGQVAVVTGAGRGIGRAIAEELAAAGAAVAVLARSAHELADTVHRIERAGGRALALPADVTDATLVDRAFADVERNLGRIDLLVNGVGALGPLGPFWTVDLEAWWQALEVVLRSHVLCTRVVLPAMVARRRGRIVNVASGAGAMVIPYFSSYNTAKTALLRFTECVAVEAAPHGVSVFAIGPGTVRTTMSEQALNSPEGRRWLPWFGRVFEAGLDVPPERAARLVGVLASGRADALAGRFLRVSDDIDAVLARLADVRRDKLYTLRVQELTSSGGNPTLRAILEAAEQP
jgi:NAD(P)-dependent dehydrogenase (short-subunit alcohol dehydrogenase family)